VELLPRARGSALKLVAAGELDGAIALSLVAWPPKGSRLEDDHIPIGRRDYPKGLRVEMRRRLEVGETLHELAEKTGLSLATVKSWCSGAERSRDAERERALEVHLLSGETLTPATARDTSLDLF
jgi:hypothetical protein